MTLGLGIGVSYGGSRASRAARLAAFSPTNVVAMSFADNSLLIRDPVTPANNYDGPLVNPATGAFNKLTFSRAGNGSLVNSSGVLQEASTNIPRISTTKIGRALVVEGSRTNLFAQPSNLSSVSWTKDFVSASQDGTLAPDGSQAWKITVDTSNNLHRTFISGTVVAGQTYGASIFLKRGSRRYISVIETSLGGVTIDTLSWTVVSGLVGATIEPWANDWYRVIIPGYVPSGVSFVLQVRLLDDSQATNYVGDGAASVYAWGAQVELGYPSTPIYNPSALTRAADSCTLSFALFNGLQTAGTIYTRHTWDGGSAIGNSSRASIALDDGTGNEAHYIYNGSAVAAGISFDGGVQQAFRTDLATADGVATKTAFAYASNDMAFCQNGRTVLTDTVNTLATTTVLRIGSHAGANFLFGGITEAAFFGARLSNAQLQALTSG